MTLKTYRTDDAVTVQVLRLRGELDLEDILKVGNQLTACLAADRVNVLLNLEHVTHIHLTGFPVLRERAGQLRLYGGGVRIVGAGPYLLNLFGLAGVKSNFSFYPTEEDALAAISLDSRATKK